MLGKSEGDDFEVKTPNGVRQLEIMEINPGETP
jgi:transcription elongation GreA/GreB family factor